MSEVNKKFTVNNLFNVEGWVAVVSGGGTGSVNTHSEIHSVMLNFKLCFDFKLRLQWNPSTRKLPSGFC